MAKKYLVCRFGGIGDAIIITPVLKWIKEKLEGETHFAVPEHQVTIFDNLDFVDKVLPTRRFMPGHMDCVPYKGMGWISLMAIMDDYDMPIDLKNSVENNSLYHYLTPKLGGWITSQNSNFQNWIDLTFSWCKINPAEVPPDEKRPIYKLKRGEVEWAKRELPEGLKIGVHCEASSHSRTWYRTPSLTKKLTETFPEATVLVWSRDTWIIITQSGQKPLKAKDLRHSIALINACDVVFSADSMISHVCEALEVPYVAVYSTVPAWTRMKYYKAAHPIEVTKSCFPCFNLHRDCPFNREHALKELTEREKKIYEARNKNLLPAEVAKEMGTTPQLIAQEHQMIVQKLDALAQKEPPCIGDIPEERIIGEIRQCIS